MHGEIKVGSKLYKVYNDPRVGRNGDVTVKTIGTKWLTVLDGSREERFDPKTWRAESGRSQLYISKEVHDAIRARADAWHKLRRAMDRYTPPEHLSTEDIVQMLEVLLPTKKEPDNG